jgi:hypothetical protein
VTGDIRKQLIEALDQAETTGETKLRRSAGAMRPHRSGPSMASRKDGSIVVDDPHPELSSGSCRAAWNGEPTRTEMAEHIARWDPSTVLRLIERDRRLLGETLGQLADDAADETARWHLDQLAALWLGSSEVTDGR